MHMYCTCCVSMHWSSQLHHHIQFGKDYKMWDLYGSFLVGQASEINCLPPPPKTSLSSGCRFEHTKVSAGLSTLKSQHLQECDKQWLWAVYYWERSPQCTFLPLSQCKFLSSHFASPSHIFWGKVSVPKSRTHRNSLKHGIPTALIYMYKWTESIKC